MGHCPHNKKISYSKVVLSFVKVLFHGLLNPVKSIGNIPFGVNKFYKKEINRTRPLL